MKTLIVSVLSLFVAVVALIVLGIFAKHFDNYSMFCGWMAGVAFSWSVTILNDKLKI